MLTLAKLPFPLDKVVYSNSYRCCPMSQDHALSRSDPDMLLVPLLRTLNPLSKPRQSHIYIILIIVLMLSQEHGILSTAHKVRRTLPLTSHCSFRHIPHVAVLLGTERDCQQSV